MPVLPKLKLETPPILKAQEKHPSLNSARKDRPALKLLENDLVDYIASDAQCVEDYADYRKAIKIAQKY